MEDHQTADMPVKPCGVSFNNKPETFVNVGFEQLENISVGFIIDQLQSRFYSLIDKTPKGLRIFVMQPKKKIKLMINLNP